MGMEGVDGARTGRNPYSTRKLSQDKAGKHVGQREGHTAREPNKPMARRCIIGSGAREALAQPIIAHPSLNHRRQEAVEVRPTAKSGFISSSARTIEDSVTPTPPPSSRNRLASDAPKGTNPKTDRSTNHQASWVPVRRPSLGDPITALQLPPTNDSPSGRRNTVSVTPTRNTDGKAPRLRRSRNASQLRPLRYSAKAESSGQEQRHASLELRDNRTRDAITTPAPGCS